MTSSFKDLSEGEYETVFPIYWQQDAPDLLAHSLSFSRKRTEITDTVHFSFTVKKSEPNVEDNNVTNTDKTDKTITKESKVLLQEVALQPYSIPLWYLRVLLLLTY